MKRLALWLALCLLISFLPATAEYEDEALFEAEVQEAEGETGAPGLIAGPDEDVLPDESGEVLPPQGEPVPESGEDVAVPPALMPGEASPGSSQASADPDAPLLSAYDLTLGVGETCELSAAMPEGRTGEVRMSSSNPGVATVSDGGLVTAVAVGEAGIRAQTPDGHFSECLVHVRQAPDQISLNFSTLEIGKGETLDVLRVTVGSAEGAFAGGYTFASQKKRVVSVDEHGVLKGLKTGKSVITATSYNGKSASCVVVVRKAPKKIALSALSGAMGVGETASLSYTLTKRSASHLSWTSDQPGIVSVDAGTGLMTAVGVGTARITAATFNGKQAACDVSVLSAPSALQFNAADLVLGVGMKTGALASVNAGAGGLIGYSSDDPAVVSVENGLVKAVALGETTVRASTYNGLSAACHVVVKPAPKSVKLPYKTLYIGVGDSVRLEPQVGDSAATFTFTSSSKKRVQVSADGVVTGLKKGKATVKITTYNKKSFKLKVVVQNAPKEISITPDYLEMSIGESVRVTGSFPDGSQGTLSYHSSDEAILRVDSGTGEVTALAAGEARVIARAYNGVEAACRVVVFRSPEWIDVTPGMIELGVGQTCALKAAMSPNSRSPLRYTSRNADVATVSPEGVVTAAGSGQTTVLIETNVPGVADEVLVTVKSAPGWVKLAVSELQLNVGETYLMAPQIPEGSVTAFVFASTDPGVATVSADGAVVAVNRGETTLSVQTHNGKSAQIHLTVVDPWYPESAALVNPPATMEIGESRKIDYTVIPSDAVPDFEWSSSNPDVASVDAAGRVAALAYGYTRITAKSRKNPDIVLEFTLGVGVESPCLVIPARTTEISGISGNLSKIDAIRRSAIAQIDGLKASGAIGESDASKRKSIVNNIFKDYAFPWMTPALQKYWKAANSEGGVKDFKPGRVYYGMPYISGTGSNRNYTAEKAVKEKRFTDSGEGYYLLNQNHLLNGKYCGCDCSSLVSAAIWGVSNRHARQRTTEIAINSLYKTLGSYDDLRPGDLLVLSDKHVVMFLYFANAERTQIMLIENGGIEPGTNTVHCSIYDLAYFSSQGYIARRLATLS